MQSPEIPATSPDARHIRWGIIGSGAIARRFLQGIEHVPSASIAGIWSRNSATSRELAAHCGALATTSPEELLALPIDAIYIATLPDTHAPYSLQALHAGKAVLCEKPVAMSVAELEQVLSTARQRSLLFMEAMKPPFFPVFRSLTHHLQSDPIGPVQFVRSGFSIRTPPGHSSWSSTSGGGSLMSIGVYHAFLALHFLGDLLDLQALGRLSHGVDAFAALTTRHTRGIAQLFSGLDLPTPPGAFLSGPLGYACLHQNWWNPERISIHYSDGRTTSLHEPVVGGGLNYETAHFCDLLRHGLTESPILTHATSLGIMHIVDRARAAIATSPYPAKSESHPDR